MIRRILLFVLVVLGLGSTARATKVFADLTKVSAVGNSTWTADTQTFTWTQSTYAFMTLPGLSGDLTEYTQLVVELEGLVKAETAESDASCRVDFELEGGSVIARVNGTIFYSDGVKTITLSDVLTAEQLSNVKAIRLNTNSDAGSVILKNACLVKPFSLSFNDDGKAYIYPSDLVEGASGLTIDEATGLVTKAAEGAASFTVELGDVDFSYVTNIAVSVDVKSEGYTDLFSTTAINNQTGTVNVWYSSKYGINYTDANRAASAHVKNIVMNADSKAIGSMKLNYICITKDLINAYSVRSLTKDDFKQWDGSGADASSIEAQPNFENHIGDAMGQGATIYGDGNVHYLNYVDMTGYKALKIKAAAGTTVRVLMNRLTGDQTNNGMVEKTPITDADGWATVDLTEYDFAHLNAVKLPWNGQTVTVEAIGLVRDGVDYYISGKGELNASVAAALADETATFIDATGLSNTTAIELQAANPNCLFVVDDAGKLSNTANVLVKGADNTYTCANLALQAGHAFRTPYAFTANEAQISKTVKASGFSTFVSPFAVPVASGCKAYNLTGVAEDKTVVMAEAATIAANAPVMLKNSGDYGFTASNVEVPATPEALTNGVLTAVYTEGVTAPKDSYVLQTQTAGTAFYKVENDGVQKVTPFTAYLTIPAEAGVNARMLAIDFEDATAVSVAVAEEADVVAIYDMQGRKVDAPVKGVNLVKLSDGSVKKLIVK